MNTVKSKKKIIALLLTLVFISTNTAYSLERTLRVPVSTKYSNERLEKTMETASELRSAAGEKLASNTGIMSNNVQGLLENISGVLGFDEKGDVIVVDANKLRSETIDYLVREAALNNNNDVKIAAQFLIRSAAASLGIIPASINGFYMARKDNAWKNMTVPAVNIRTDGYETARQIFRVVKEQNIGTVILELAKSEARYSGQSLGEFTTVGFAAAIKEGYAGQIFFQGDHYQVDKKKYDQDPQKEIASLKKFIRESVLAGEYNIDLDPSTLVNETALDEIVIFENSLVDEYFKTHPESTQGLDESGLKALRHKLIDELALTDAQKTQLDALYERLHSDTAKATMEFIRYIRSLEKELLDGKITISIGIEERHIDNPKHKSNPSTVRGSIALANKILKICAEEGLVVPSKIALQTGTMHGLGGEVDFGIYERHLAATSALGIAVFVQHGASTIKDRNDFKKMPIGGVGEVHLATEYQKITLGIIAKMMPDLAEKMAQYLEKLMAEDPDGYGKKFGDKWAKAFGDPAQQGKTRHEIIVEILADELPEKLQGSLKDLTKELSGPFKNEIWNTPLPVRETMRQALYKEFSEIFQMIGVSETKQLVESILPVAKQPVMLAQRPEALTQAMRSAGTHDATSDRNLASNGGILYRKQQVDSMDHITAVGKTKNFGKTGLSFFPIGLGTIWFGRIWPPGNEEQYQKPTSDEIDRHLQYAFKYMGNETGVVMIDTSAAYDEGEEIIGEYLRSHPHLLRKAFISTKWGEYFDAAIGKSAHDYTKSSLVSSVSDSLKKLGKIDLLYIHGTGPKDKVLGCLRDQEVIDEMNRMKEEGKIRYIGVSISKGDILEQAVNEDLLEGFDAVQIPIDLYKSRQDLVNFIYNKGIAIVINSPVRKGGSSADIRKNYAELLSDDRVAVVLTEPGIIWVILLVM